MKEPNKLMLLLMNKVIKFECQSCARYWSYEDYQMHKLRGNCRKDPYATNQTSILNRANQPVHA